MADIDAVEAAEHFVGDDDLVQEEVGHEHEELVARWHALEGAAVRGASEA